MYVTTGSRVTRSSILWTGEESAETCETEQSLLKLCKQGKLPCAQFEMVL